MTSARIKIDIDDSLLNAKLREQEVKMKQSFNRMSQSGSALDNMVNRVKGSMGSMIPVASLASAGLIFRQILDTSREFSKEFSAAMAEVETISTAVKNNNKGISDEIIKMAANGKAGAIELAKAYYQIVSAGHDGAKGLELLSVASKAATAGVTDTKTAADGLTTILNAWSKDASEAERVADAMFTTVRLGKTTFGELSSQIAQVAPLAASMKIPFEQILSAVASLTFQGVPTAQAVTQIRSSLVNLNKVLPEGWQKMYTYQEALQKVYTMANGSQNELRKLIPDIEGVSAVLGLSGEKAETAAGHLNEFAKATGEMQTAYNRMIKEADAVWSQVHNRWARELKQIGDASLIASTGTAQFFNAMLTGMEDIQNKVPVINGFFDRIAGLKMLGNNSIQAYLKALVTPNWSVQDDLGKIIDEGNKGIPEKKGRLAEILGIEDAQKRLEALSEFLKQVQGEQAELDKYTPLNKASQAADQLKRSNLSDLVQQINDAIAAAQKLDTETTKTASKFKTVADAEAKIKELEQKLGTGTIEQEIKIIAKIRNEQEFIDDFNKKVRKAIEDSYNLTMTDSYGLNLKMKPLETYDPKKQKLETDKILATQKQLTAEQKKQVAEMKKQDQEQQRLLEIEIQRAAVNKKISEGFSDASEVLDVLSYSVGELDADLAESLAKMSDLAGNASEMFKGLSTKDYFGAVISAIAVLGNLFGALKNDTESDSSYVEKSIQRQNELLSVMMTYLDTLRGEDYFVYARKTLAKYNDDLTVAWNNLKKFKTVQLNERDPITGAFIKINTENFELPDWIDLIDRMEKEGVWNNSPAFKEIKDYVLQIQDLGIAVDKLLEQTWNKVTGTSRDSIADGIIEGFKKGYDSAADFADNFEELMKTAVINAFRTQLIEGDLTEWYKGFAEDGMDGYTKGEIDFWKKKWDEIIETNKIRWDNIEKVTGVNPNNTDPTSTQQQGLSGAIRGITEETAGLIAGQFNAMRIELKGINDNTKLIENQFMMMDEALSTLDRIAQNTSHNKRLNDVCTLIEKTNKLLEQGL
ncbi:MAG TPA: phage tail tape measure protein [Draconibacterium sp.]|nr:phage tail tape measure protein [Draconibacterium sp.]